MLLITIASKYRKHKRKNYRKQKLENGKKKYYNYSGDKPLSANKRISKKNKLLRV